MKHFLKRATHLLFLALFALPMATHAQVDSTLILVRAAGVDSADAEIPYFFSPDYEQRAAELAVLLQSADTYLQKALGVHADLNLAVLDESAWMKVWPFPYGLPYVSLSEPWTVVMPATPERSVLYYPFQEALGAEEAHQMIDNIGFHEVGHVYISAYLYPPDTQGPPPVRWLDEFLGQYAAYAILKEVSPDRSVLWDRYTKHTLSQPAFELTSLTDFDAEYYGFLGGPEGAPNYAWYQSVFAKKATEIYGDLGLEFLKDLKKHLPWETFDAWTTESVLSELEQLRPGFQLWAERLERL